MHKKPKIIFIGGVHGVGKTTLCTKICSSSQYKHYSASHLIKEQKAEAIAEKSKRVSNIDSNQDLLQNALNKLNDSHVLLDGHFTLLDKDGVIQNIPKEVFKAISPEALIVITERPEIIAERISKRDLDQPDVTFIEKHQDIEISHGKKISDDLKIPFYEITSRTDLSHLIKEI